MAPRRPIKRWALAVVLTIGLPAMSLAAGGFTFALPIGAKNPSGLRLSIDGHGIDANGYRPVVIQFSTRGGTPLPADRQVRVVLEFSRYGLGTTAKVSQIVELPEGSTSVKATILVPQAGSWSDLSVETYEGGEQLKDLSHAHFRWANTLGWSWTEAVPAFLLIDSDVPKPSDRAAAVNSFRDDYSDLSPTYSLPDARPLFTLFPDTNTPAGPPSGAAIPALSAAKISDTAVLSIIEARPRSEIVAPAELPTRWIELSQFDVAIISLADLQRMAKSHSGQLAALRDWLSTGPLLIVYGVQNDFARLAELEKVLELPSLSSDEESQEYRGWTRPIEVNRTSGLHAPFDEADDSAAIAVPGRPRNFTARLSAKRKGSGNAAAVRTTASSGNPPFVFRSAALGCIAAIASEKPFPGVRSDWAWIFNSVPDNHWKWFRRSGFSMQRTNNDYWKFLIPGVGEAPVVSFLVLVSLFAVAIGPVNYLLLGRARRLYLLLLTVPACATLVTASLFVFAMFSDGFSTRLRARSFADLDQRIGRAAVWSRQSYYAAMAPSQGLVFSDDATVFPLLHEPNDRSADRPTLLAWDGDQHLRRGYLSSRTAAQFMVCRATTSKAGLIVTEGNQAGQEPKIENRLASRIQYLLLRDSRGEYYAGQSIDDKQTKGLSSVNLEVAAAAMRKLADAVTPMEPHGYNPKIHDDTLFLRFSARRSGMPTSDGGAGEPAMDKSLLETNIDSAIQPTTRSLSPGTYIAIVDSSPVVVLGVPRAREEAGFHIIRGRY